jgi:hypothetical protein
MRSACPLSSVSWKLEACAICTAQAGNHGQPDPQLAGAGLVVCQENMHSALKRLA